MEENPLKSTIQRLMPLEKKKAIVLDWLEIPQPKRVPRNPKDLAKQLDIDIQLIKEWTTEAKVEKQMLRVETKVQERKEKAYNSKDYFLSKKKELDEGMVKAVGRGNAQMAKLIKQLTGELVEKQEVTHKGLSADDISRLSKKAADELGDFLPRIREVSPESALLPGNIRKN